MFTKLLTDTLVTVPNTLISRVELLTAGREGRVLCRLLKSRPLVVCRCTPLESLCQMQTCLCAW